MGSGLRQENEQPGKTLLQARKHHLRRAGANTRDLRLRIRVLRSSHIHNSARSAYGIHIHYRRQAEICHKEAVCIKKRKGTENNHTYNRIPICVKKNTDQPKCRFYRPYLKYKSMSKSCHSIKMQRIFGLVEPNIRKTSLFPLFV